METNTANMVRIDWLNNAIRTDGQKGYLICGPYKGQYKVNFGGAIVSFDSTQVLIQLLQFGPFIMFKGL